MKILSIVGARPQFIKAAAVSRVLRMRHTEMLLHTGQHYDYGMSQVFFDELNIPKADINLGIGSGNHGEQTGAILAGIERILLEHQPEMVLVYGDTNSTLAGALAAAKLHIPVAHVEAGLRSFNRAMPEEINRVVTDHVSDVLLCPSRTAVDNLMREGITKRVHLVGDVMSDALIAASERARERSPVLEQLGVAKKGYLLATVHRAENTDDPTRLQAILAGFATSPEPIIFPIHPRTRARLATLNPDFVESLSKSTLRMIDPVGYLDMVMLEQSARMILTDSGGIQKEAYWLGVPCVTLRDETEWVETVEHGWNRLVGAQQEHIVDAICHWSPSDKRPPLYGEGQAVEDCVHVLEHGSPRHSPPKDKPL
jgi:UDP-N-acetylglucosamine 2-epimerase